MKGSRHCPPLRKSSPPRMRRSTARFCELPAVAAKAAPSTSPIVFSAGYPVQTGLVESYNRPGGNITGIDVMATELEAKRIGFLHDLVPQATTIGFLLNPALPEAKEQQRA